MCKAEFLTVAKPSESLYTVKKSKFISNVVPIKDNEEAEDYIKKIRKKYWDATHNVYAYVLGLNDDIQKFSDDGEPSGTAGKPVLEVIKSNNIKNVLIVVTRYFGGILLGAGGLVRAYSESASRGLKNSSIIKKIRCNAYKIITDYNMLGKVQWELNQRNIIINDINYTENVQLNIYVPIIYNIDLEQLISNITSGSALIEWVGNYYVTQYDF
ncbi:MAG: YigZ family protein [Tepidanaerobacter acetatoxydans]|uniref:YigZ family protein n=1 Tax=Tepidanaerobacter TaxID=499228 RepID=UPI000A4A75F5|nr:MULTISPECIES: YigZ family protein [Tepidanaerobacter]NLU10880.1 YigZ family protein [Tepidanaerobacter acetatoxydans]